MSVPSLEAETLLLLLVPFVHVSKSIVAPRW